MADVAFAGFKVRVAAVALEEWRRLSYLGRHVQLVLVPVPTGSRRKHLAAPLADYGTVVLNEVFQQLGKQRLLIFLYLLRSLSAPSLATPRSNLSHTLWYGGRVSRSIESSYSL